MNSSTRAREAQELTGRVHGIILYQERFGVYPLYVKLPLKCIIIERNSTYRVWRHRVLRSFDKGHGDGCSHWRY